MRLIRFKSPAEIRALRGYVERLPRGQQKFVGFIGWYKFPDRADWQRCAKADCNHSHSQGYVVRTAAGAVAAIGHICGERVFGPVFAAARTSIDKVIARDYALQGLADSLGQLPELQQRVEELLNGPRGAHWFDRAAKSFQEVCPRSLLSTIYDRGSRRDGVIVISRKRTENDVPPAGTRGASPYVEERVAVIRGIGALALPPPLDILQTRVLSQLLIYRQMTPGYLIDNKPVRDRFTQRFTSVRREIQDAESRLKDAVRFFDTANLRQLAHLARNPQDRALLSRLLWNEAEGRVEIERDSLAG